MASKRNDDLIKSGIIKDVFEYQGFDSEKVKTYAYFENKFLSLFQSHANAFGLNNFFFYIKNDNSCNAFASKINGSNIIGITNGYPIFMESKFDKKYFSTIFIVALINEESISEAYCDLEEDPNFKFNEFMLNCSIEFTFGHEFQHILQLNSSEITHDFRYSENFSENFNATKFDIKKHAWEFDADRMASFQVLKYIFSEYRKLTSKNTEKLTCMIYIGLASMIITISLFYFGIMSQFPPNYSIDRKNFYTKEFSHPHPLVRTINIVEYFYVNAKCDFPELKIEIQEILNNVLGIMKIYFDSLIPNQRVMDCYFGDLGKFLDEINRYNQELYDFAIKDKSIKNLLKTRGINF